MKTRTGFVSNSSSSSFIIIGANMTDEIQEKLKLRLQVTTDDTQWIYDKERELKELGLEALYIEGTDADYVIGHVIADIGDEDGYIPEQSMSINDIKEISDKLKEVLGKDVEIKLMLGTRPS